MSFTHLHVHTQYSILDGLSNIGKLFDRADELGMKGLAITDHGNMYGVKEFFKYAAKHPNVKPIIGCEIYVTRGFSHTLKDKAHKQYYHLILLAKNYNGYKNLIKIVSTAHIEGFYNMPRVSHEVIEKYHEDLICSSACMVGEVPQKILAGDIQGAEDAIEWHKRVFGEDYYLEVMLHKTEVPGLSLETYESQKAYDEVIFELAGKHGVKVIATNDVHFVMKEDGPTHDRLICLTTNAKIEDTKRLRYSQQEWLKSEEEMRELFPDHPEAIDNTQEILDKVESYTIDRGHVLPKFELPEDFLSEIDTHLEKHAEVIKCGELDEKGNDRGEVFKKSVAYLCHLTYKGAHERYGDVLNDETAERIDFELKTISRMGFPDYFLIVQDFINWGKTHGVSVGPGRGSAAGSAVAYCLKITNLDPIKYDLLFERFLNPERISMPDIDVDFDVEGRYRVIQYVQEKYGEDHISHVITFGTMAAKGAIRDVGRISDLPLDEVGRLTKLIPDRGIVTKDENGEEKTLPTTLKNCLKYVPEFKEAYEQGSDLLREVIDYAIKLEGSIRQVGIHACAMIIGRGNLTDYIPITTGVDKATNQKVWVSQYEGCFIEDVGMLKMDFLGLNTLSIIMECLNSIKKRYGRDIDIEAIPTDDKKVFELFGRGDTKSVFQFESAGMREWLQKLRPQRFEDLIAMNALYRPGPMDYIPSFVARKRGEEEIAYDLPVMGEFLEETYGVTVYQEQVMRISQKVANFSKGKADKLRKAMGKKQLSVLESLHEEFISGGTGNGHPLETLEKIWADWRKFASYAFNKSHATCYAWVAYQTAWLKTHYQAEFQAANLSQNLSNMAEIQEIMDDCKKNRIKVLSPDINESDNHFSVNNKGEIRFGLGGMKGFGENIVLALIKNREEKGPFADIYDFCERMNGIVNRSALEILVYSGSLDSFGIKRSCYFTPGASGDLFIEELDRYGKLCSQDQDAGPSLFGDVEELRPVKPEPPTLKVEEDTLELLQKEKEFVGMYLSSHPLDKYSFELEHFTTCKLSELEDLVTQCEKDQKGMKVNIGGFITSYKTMTTKMGKPFSKTTLEDFSGTYEVVLFGQDHDTFMSYLMKEHTSVFIEGEIAEKFPLRSEEKKMGKKATYAFKVKKVMSLGNVTDSFLGGFAMYISTPQLSDSFRGKLLKTVKESSGKIPLSIVLFDPKTRYKVEMVSKKYTVGVTSDLIGKLKDLGVNYKVVQKS